MRRTKEETEKTRKSILKAALKVFYKKGVARASLAEIGKAAGVTRGAIYWHFKDKYDLYLSLYEMMTKRFSVRPEDIESQSFDTPDAFKATLLKYLTDFQTNREFNMFLLVVYSRTEYIEELQPIIDNELKKQRLMIDAYQHALEELQAKGAIAAHIRCAHFARILYTCIDGIVDSAGIDPTLFDGEVSAASMLDEIFLMLCK